MLAVSKAVAVTERETRGWAVVVALLPLFESLP